MVRKLIVAAFVAIALVVPTVVGAHTGHPHKVMGTVSSIDGNHLMVKTTDGKTVMVMLDAKTTITRGKAKIDVAALKIGERVVAAGPEDKQKMILATSVQVAAALPAAPASK
jgi:hypothetical protein